MSNVLTHRRNHRNNDSEFNITHKGGKEMKATINAVIINNEDYYEGQIINIGKAKFRVVHLQGKQAIVVYYREKSKFVTWCNKWLLPY